MRDGKSFRYRRSTVKWRMTAKAKYKKQSVRSICSTVKWMCC